MPPDTSTDTDQQCPACGSDATVGFATGDRVCRQCNHNWDPDDVTDDANADAGAQTPGPSAMAAGNLATVLRAEPFMSGANTYENTARGTVKVSCGGNADLTPTEATGIQDSDHWRIARVSASYVEIEEADN